MRGGDEGAICAGVNAGFSEDETGDAGEEASVPNTAKESCETLAGVARLREVLDGGDGLKELLDKVDGLRDGVVRVGEGTCLSVLRLGVDVFEAGGDTATATGALVFTAGSCLLSDNVRAREEGVEA